MSDQERLIVRGQLSELQKKAEELRIRITGLRKSLRINLNEFLPVEDLDAGVISDQALEMSGLVIDYREALAQIQAMKKALGL